MEMDLTDLSDTTPFHASSHIGNMIEGAAACLTAVGSVSGSSVTVFQDRGCTGADPRTDTIKFKPLTEMPFWTVSLRAEQFGLCIAFRYSRSLANKVVDCMPTTSTAYDYYLKDSVDTLEFTGILEVSGIENGNTSTLRSRVKEKIDRLHDSGYNNQAWVVIVAMANPLEICVVVK